MSILSRKRDLLYLTFFIIHLPVIFRKTKLPPVSTVRTNIHL